MDNETFRKLIEFAAREYVGTPYHHLGRLKHIGIDCVGLIVQVGKELKLINEDYLKYDKFPNKDILTERLKESSLEPVEIEDIQIGDILVFWISPKTKAPQHMAIRTSKGIIHVHAGVGKVVEHGLDKKWKRRICGAFKYRGIE